MGIQGPAACRRAVTKPNEDPIKFREKLLDFFQVNKVLEEMLETKKSGRLFAAEPGKVQSGPDSSVDVIVKLPFLFNVKGFGRIFFSFCRKPRQGQLFFCRKNSLGLAPNILKPSPSLVSTFPESVEVDQALQSLFLMKKGFGVFVPVESMEFFR
jgi:hypothetical protein